MILQYSKVHDNLYERGLYLVGDLAYSIRNFLMCPFDNVKPNSKKDNFNFFFSSQRIYVECAFGEIDRRWGIFWRPLEGGLNNKKSTIDAAMRLHNFIVEYREDMKGDGMGINDDNFDTDELMYDSDEFSFNNAGVTLGVFGDGTRPGGRPANNKDKEKSRGLELQNNLCNMIKEAGLSRPDYNEMSERKDRHNRTVVNE